MALNASAASFVMWDKDDALFGCGTEGSQVLPKRHDPPLLQPLHFLGGLDPVPEPYAKRLYCIEDE
jgi:hypothetical protein